MSKQSVQYHYLACDGRTDNILVPSCPAVSAGDTDEGRMLNGAAIDGWVVTERKTYCPVHAPAPAAAPKRRPKAEPVTDGQQQG